MIFVSEQKDGIIIRLHIQPGASKNELVGLHGDRLKIRLKAPPVEGKANKELINYLSKVFEIPKNEIEIISGQTGRRKNVKIIGITKDHLFQIIKIK
jgi:uncharacterized protein (TIGR00251 family)